jgi:hypothetical protein
MARKRMLQPSFFTSGPVNNLTYTAMITFAGLWCYFDDYGRGEDHAALVKASVWPRRRAHTEKHVANDLDLIAAEHLICRYQVSGVRLIHSPNWNEHQKISHRTPSKLPPCPAHEPAEYDFYLHESGDGRDRFRNGSGKAPETLANSSGRAPP